MSDNIKRALFVPTDPKQEAIHIEILSVELLAHHYELNLPDGTQKLIPRDQVKEFRLLDGDHDSNVN